MAPGPGFEPGVHLIETATCPRDGRSRIIRARRWRFLPGTVAGGTPAVIGSRIHEGMCWGAAANEKNGSTTSKTKTVTTRSPNRTPPDKTIDAPPFKEAATSLHDRGSRRKTPGPT